MKYSLNKDAIIFLDADRQNNYNTIAYDYQDDDILAIRPAEYRLLRYVYENQSVSYEEISNFLSGTLTDREVSTTLHELVSKKLLINDQ